MKGLVVYYSRSGTTRTVGEFLARELGFEKEEIFDADLREGVAGYLRAGHDAVMKKPALIRDMRTDPSKYECVVIGTPVWAFTLASAVRTYFERYKGKLPVVAFFCTQGGAGEQKTFRDMAALAGRQPIERLMVLTKDVAKGGYQAAAREFVAKIRAAAPRR